MMVVRKYQPELALRIVDEIVESERRQRRRRLRQIIGCEDAAGRFQEIYEEGLGEIIAAIYDWAARPHSSDTGRHDIGLIDHRTIRVDGDGVEGAGGIESKLVGVASNRLGYREGQGLDRAIVLADCRAPIRISRVAIECERA